METGDKTPKIFLACFFNLFYFHFMVWYVSVKHPVLCYSFFLYSIIFISLIIFKLKRTTFKAVFFDSENVRLFLNRCIQSAEKDFPETLHCFYFWVLMSLLFSAGTIVLSSLKNSPPILFMCLFIWRHNEEMYIIKKREKENLVL